MLSGWQRLGVVVSVLWLALAPAYLLFAENRRARDFYGNCRGASRSFEASLRAHGKHEAANVERRDAHETCWNAAGFLSPERLIGALFDFDDKSARFWGFLLAPIAFLWASGSAAISTVRWIIRGFHPE
jgi:hypothetical protein